MIRYSEYKPRIISVLGTGSWDEIDRVQSIDKTGTVNKLAVEEVGRDGVVEYVNQAPTVAYRMVQMEYGEIDFFNKIANKADGNDVIVLNDFKTSIFDICSYMTDDDGTFKGTNWIPKLRVAGFSINIGSPRDLIQRNFDFVGEDWINWQGANKYLIYKEAIAESGDTEIVITDPAAVKDPDSESGSDIYILRVVRVSSGVSTELTTDDYTYVAGTLTVENCVVGDTIKYWYTATTYIGGEVPFTANDSDLPAIHADSASVYLESGNYVYRLQNVNIDVRLTRQDEGEVGNKDIVQRGVSDKVVTITLNRNLEDLTIEELIAGQSANYGKLDIRKYTDNLTLRVKLYADNTKEEFKIGFKCAGLAPSEIRSGAAIKAYVPQGNSLIGKNLTISVIEALIDGESGI